MQAGVEDSTVRRAAFGTCLVLFVVALTIRVVFVLVTGFDGLYGQDAFAYYDQAVAIANAIPRGERPPADFFWPNGYPAIAAAVMWLVGQRTAAAQAVSLLAGAAVAPLSCVLCWHLFPRAPARAGFLAGAIVAVAGQAVVSSVVIMADMAALFWTTLAAWLAVRRGRGSRVLHGAASGAALGMAVITRWLSGVIVPAFLLHSWRQARGVRPWLRVIAPTLVAGAVIVVPQIALSVQRPGSLAHSWLTGWRPTNMFRSHFETIDGFASYTLPVGAYYLAPAAHPAYLVPPLALFTCWGVIYAWRTRADDALVLLLGWLSIGYVFLAGIPYQNLRFGLSLWLPVVVFTAVGAADASARPRWRTLTAVVVGLSLAAMLVWSGRSVVRLVGAQAARADIARRVERRLPSGSTLLTFGLTHTARHVTGLRVVEFFEQDERSLPSLVRGGATYLLLDTANAEQQWRGRAPARNYRWLQEHAGLTILAEYPPYTLFELVPR